MRRIGRLLGPVAALLAAGALLAVPACSKNVQGSADRAVPVSVAVAHTEDVPVEVKSFGSVEPYASIAVKAQVAGVINEVLVQQGQHVKAKQPLMRIDKRTFEATARQLEANLARDTAHAELARHEADKLDKLLKQGASTPDESYQAKATADAAVATVAADKAELENARLQVSFCDICSPVDGVAGKMDISQGNVVKAYDVSIITINQVQPIYVSFTLPQQYLPDIRQYVGEGKVLTVRAQLPGSSDVESGTLCFIDNAVDAATGTIRLRGSFENAKERLWPGQFFNVSLVLTTKKDCVIVPAHAVQTGQEGQFVFVVKDDQSVDVRPVKSSMMLGNDAVVEGVQAGETVVTDGQLRLVKGAKVRILEQKSASRPATSPASQPAKP